MSDSWAKTSHFSKSPTLVSKQRTCKNQIRKLQCSCKNKGLLAVKTDTLRSKHSPQAVSAMDAQVQLSHCSTRSTVHNRQSKERGQKTASTSSFEAGEPWKIMCWISMSQSINIYIYCGKPSSCNSEHKKNTRKTTIKSEKMEVCFPKVPASKSHLFWSCPF